MSPVVPLPDGVNTDTSFALSNWTFHTLQPTKSDGLWFLQLLDCSHFGCVIWEIFPSPNPTQNQSLMKCRQHHESIWSVYFNSQPRNTGEIQSMNRNEELLPVEDGKSLKAGHHRGSPHGHTPLSTTSKEAGSRWAFVDDTITECIQSNSKQLQTKYSMTRSATTLWSYENHNVVLWMPHMTPAHLIR